MSKNLILFLLISFCSFSGGINEKSIEESLNDLCDRISHCRSDEEAKKSSILRILGNSLYEFNYQDKNGNYKFYIPEDTEIVKGKNKNIFLIIYKIHLAYSTENIIVAELTKGKTSKFTFNTEKFEDYMNYRLGNEVNSKDKILEFRKRLLDRNKNFIKKKEDIEYSNNKLTSGINGKNIEESLNDLCDRISHCRSDEEAKKSSILRILGNSLYEFNYQDKNGNYKFYIPEDTEIVKGKNKNIFLIIYKIHLAYSTENIIVAELTKGKTSKFTFNTEKFEDYMNYRLGNEINSKDKVLEFRKRLLDRNKNFIKEKEDIEFEKKL